MVLDHFSQHMLQRANMELFTWIILGVLAGSIVANALQEKHSEYILDSILGVIGATLAGFIVQIFSLQHIGGIYDETIVVTVLGAGIVIWFGKKVLIKGT